MEQTVIKNLTEVTVKYPEQFVQKITNFIEKYGKDNTNSRLFNLAINGRYSVGSLISDYIDELSDRMNIHFDKQKIYYLSNLYDEWIEFVNDNVLD